MTDAFTQTLHLRVHTSAWHQCLVLAIYAIVVGVVLALALYRPWLGLLLPCVLTAGLLAWRRALLRNDASVIRLRWQGDDTWTWQTRDGRWHTGTRRHAVVFGTVLVILTLRSRTTRWRRARILLFRDGLDADRHRRLRARLTVAPAPENVADA